MRRCRSTYPAAMVSPTESAPAIAMVVIEMPCAGLTDTTGSTVVSACGSGRRMGDASAEATSDASTSCAMRCERRSGVAGDGVAGVALRAAGVGGAERCAGGVEAVAGGCADGAGVDDEIEYCCGWSAGGDDASAGEAGGDDAITGCGAETLGFAGGSV